MGKIVDLDEFKHSKADPDATYYTREEFINGLEELSKEVNIPIGNNKLLGEWNKRKIGDTKRIVPLRIYVEVVEELFPDFPVSIPVAGHPNIMIRYDTKNGYHVEEEYLRQFFPNLFIEEKDDSSPND